MVGKLQIRKFKKKRVSPPKYAGLGVFKDLLNSCPAFIDTTETILTKSCHPEFNRFLLHHHRWRTLNNKISNRIGYIKQLIKTGTAFISGLSTSGTATSSIEVLISEFMRSNS